jgi:hypothetical protein
MFFKPSSPDLPLHPNRKFLPWHSHHAMRQPLHFRHTAYQHASIAAIFSGQRAKASQAFDMLP